MSGTFDFAEAFEALTRYEPFPWQARLFKRLSAGDLPPAVDIPTGLGKTSVMALWLLARAAGAPLPRRLVHVVDRRAVVDQATDFAEKIREALSRPELEGVRRGLALGDRPLAISTLRGKYVDNREWLEDPAAPAIIVGTVDMIGSRLLFEGYGVSRRMRPYAAGLMGCDALVMLDEAHLSRPFERLLRTIETGQRAPEASHAGQPRGRFAGTQADTKCPPPFRVLPLSATLGDASGAESPFTLDDDDRANETVRARLEASKTLTIEDLDKDTRLEDMLAERAWGLMRDESGAAARLARTLIYCHSRKVAEEVAEAFRKQARKEAFEAEVILFVGGRRVYEREQAARQLKEHGLIAGSDAVPKAPIFVVATSAGEVGVDLDADHMVCDLVAWERMVQRLGRVNRRGMGAARVLVIQEPPDKKEAGEAGIDRQAVRELLEALPQDEAGGHQAGPAALAALAGLESDPETRKRIAEASTPVPLYPALTRPLVDAWAMTSLTEHTGRPEVAPWLRGWVDEKPQTTVVWRRFLPVQFEGVSAGTRIPVLRNSEIEEFFEAAPPQGAELLETETLQVVEWLKKRARGHLNKLAKGKAGKRVPSDGETGENGDASVVEAEGSALLPPLNPDSPIAFLLDGNGKLEGTLSFKDVAGTKDEELIRRLAGRKLMVDARLNGLNHGLLDAGHDEPVLTIEDHWGKSEVREDALQIESSADDLPAIRVRVLSDGARSRLADEREKPHEDGGSSPDPWHETLAVPLQQSPDGDSTAVWLVVEKLRGAETDEEARAMAPDYQTLHEHQTQVRSEAKRIATALNLAEEDRAMLAAAALHHDDGKKASCWQRAFNAKREGGPYAKTRGPLNRKVLNGYRHEFQSMLDAEETGLDGLDRADPRFDLALHLIAAHHGRARPVIGIEGRDSLPPTAAAHRARGAALRFARLQRQWGPWGLAWWEALLRAADQRMSRAWEETVLRELRKNSPRSATPSGSQELQPDLFAGDAKETD